MATNKNNIWKRMGFSKLRNLLFQVVRKNDVHLSAVVLELFGDISLSYETTVPNK